MLSKISPCLWFNNQAEDADRFYTGIFKDSKITAISRYGEAGKEIHGKEPGSVMTGASELNGQSFTALNGGTDFKQRRNRPVATISSTTPLNTKEQSGF